MAVLLHDLKGFNNHLGRRADNDLALALLLGVVGAFNADSDQLVWGKQIRRLRVIANVAHRRTCNGGRLQVYDAGVCCLWS